MDNLAQEWSANRGPHARLSAREEEVLEIARRLHVTVHAVKFHLAGVYRKLEVANRTEAAAVYLTGARLPERRELA